MFHGDEREMVSGLIFNQLVASSSLVIPAKLYVGRSSTGRALHCECSPLRVQVPSANPIVWGVRQEVEATWFSARQSQVRILYALPISTRSCSSDGKSARLSTGRPRVQVSSAPPNLIGPVAKLVESNRLLSGGTWVRIPPGPLRNITGA